MQARATFHNGGMSSGVFRKITSRSKAFLVTLRLNSPLPQFKRELSVSSVFNQSKMSKNVGESHNFPKEETEILELWKKIDAFKTSLKLSEGRPRYNLLCNYLFLDLLIMINRK